MLNVRKVVVTLLVSLVSVVGGVAAIVFTSIEPAAPSYAPSEASLVAPLPARFRTWEEHDEIVRRFGKPYVLELNHRHGSLLFFGARHTSDPKDPQLADIDRRWRSFKPTVALYEGRQRNFVDTSVIDWLKGKSEAEKLHHLATRDGVRMFTLEPEYEREVAELLEKWPAEKVALFFFTRVYWGESGGESDEGLALDLLQKRTAIPALRGSLRDLADVDRIWKRDFPSLPDWRTNTVSEPEGTYLFEIADDSRRIRGEHMARTIIELTNQGERVFAVVGSGHVIRLEPVLRAALDGPISQ
jgi:hypothetical protein